MRERSSHIPVGVGVFVWNSGVGNPSDTRYSIPPPAPSSPRASCTPRSTRTIYLRSFRHHITSTRTGGTSTAETVRLNPTNTMERMSARYLHAWSASTIPPVLSHSLGWVCLFGMRAGNKCDTRNSILPSAPRSPPGTPRTPKSATAT